MPWQALQVGVFVIGLALLFAGGAGLGTGRPALVVIAAAGLVILCVAEIFVVRRYRRQRVRPDPDEGA